ncbi:MAG: hypothetical protein ACREI9_01485 [Nitrospiraceae bacterium]
MTIRWIDVRILLPTLVLVAGACAADGGYSSSSSGNGGSIAAGSVEDTLKACLSRIPSDASEGQRLIAEKSCERDQANRK